MNQFWNMVRFAIRARVTADGNADMARSTPGKPGSQQGQERFTRYYPWGYDSRMPAGGRDVLVAPQGGSNLAAVGGRHDSFKPDVDDDSWSQMLHNEVSGTWVKLRKDGGIKVEARGSTFELKADGSAKLTDSGGASVELTGDVIKFNGGGKSANRRGDPVIPSLPLVGWLLGLATAAHYATPFPSDFASTGDGNPKVTMP